MVMTLEIPEATDPVPCPLCGDTEGAVVGEKGRFGMPVRNVCCATCATVYVSPRPTAGAMGEYYRSTYRKHYGGVGYIGPDGKRAAPGAAGYEAALQRWHSPQADNALLLGETPRGASVLEIGCRHGRTLELMRERRGIVPFAVEPGESDAQETSVLVRPAQAHLVPSAQYRKLPVFDHVARVTDASAALKDVHQRALGRVERDVHVRPGASRPVLAADGRGGVG